MATTPLDLVTMAPGNTVPDLVVSAGADRRAFVLVFHTHGSNASPPSSMTAGGVTMDVLATVDDDANTFDICCRLFGLDEAGISAMSGGTLVPTGGTYTNRQFITWTVKDATQGALNIASAATTGTTGSVSLSRVANSYTVAATGHDWGASDGFSGLTNPSESGEQRFTLGDVAWGAESDTERTADFTWTHAGSQNNVTIAINIPPAVNAGAISGNSLAESAAAGALTTPGITFTLRDIDSNQTKNTVTYANVHAVNAASRGTIAASMTNKATNSVGVMTLRAPGISIVGATYDVVGWSSDGSDRFHASAVCSDM